MSVHVGFDIIFGPDSRGKVKDCLSENDLARRMGEAGRRRAEEEFDERAVLDRQIDAYKRALGRDLPG